MVWHAVSNVRKGTILVYILTRETLRVRTSARRYERSIVQPEYCMRKTDLAFQSIYLLEAKSDDNNVSVQAILEGLGLVSNPK